jgi:hypothetical protein
VKIIEKHGALWDEASNGEIVFECFNPVAEKLGIVTKSKTGAFVATQFEKRTREPQWTGIWWDVSSDGCLFNNVQDARDYLERFT